MPIRSRQIHELTLETQDESILIEAFENDGVKEVVPQFIEFIKLAYPNAEIKTEPKAFELLPEIEKVFNSDNREEFIKQINCLIQATEPTPTEIKAPIEMVIEEPTQKVEIIKEPRKKKNNTLNALKDDLEKVGIEITPAKQKDNRPHPSGLTNAEVWDIEECLKRTSNITAAAEKYAVKIKKSKATAFVKIKKYLVWKDGVK